MKKDINGVPANRWQIIQIGQQKPAGGGGNDYESRNQAYAARPSARYPHELGSQFFNDRLTRGIVFVADPFFSRNRQNGNRDEHGNRHTNGDGYRQIGKELPFGIVQKYDRQEDCDRRRGRGEQRSPDLPRSFVRGRTRIISRFTPPDNVFHDHDRRIEDHAGGKGEPCQRNHIQGAPERK